MGLFFWKFPKSSTLYVEKSKNFRFKGNPNQTLGYVGKCINCEPIDHKYNKRVVIALEHLITIFLTCWKVQN